MTEGVEERVPPPKRTLPLVTQDMVAYFAGGATGELLIYRCRDCAYYVHPPVRFCPQCESRAVAPEPVSGRGEVVSCTVVHRQFVPGLPVPYVIALVGLDEQRSVQLPTNIVHCDPEAVTIGMRVQVTFEQHEELWIPFFEPEGT